MGKTVEEMNAAHVVVDAGGNLIAACCNYVGARALADDCQSLGILFVRPANEDDIAEIGRRVNDDI